MHHLERFRDLAPILLCVVTVLLILSCARQDDRLRRTTLQGAASRPSPAVGSMPRDWHG
jgi:hypothetical protein